MNEARNPEGLSSIIISHANCPDGVVAAWLLKKMYNGAIVHFTRERDFYADKKMPDLTDRVVWIVDYSYPATIIKYLMTICKKIIILDHHKTALEDLSSFFSEMTLTPADNCITYVTDKLSMCIDLTKCGAEIVYDTQCAVNGMPKPWFIKHIRDRDLWLWENEGSKEFSQAFFNRGLNMENLDKIVNFNDNEIHAFYQEGKELLDIQQKCIDEAVNRAEVMHMNVDNETKPYTILIVNQTEYQSEVGNALCSKDINNYLPIEARTPYPRYSDFAVVFRSGDKGRSMSSFIADPQTNLWFSLRGAGKRPDGTFSPDTSVISKKFGGGGHPNASGFEMKLCEKNLRIFVPPLAIFPGRVARARKILVHSINMVGNMFVNYGWKYVRKLW